MSSKKPLIRIASIAGACLVGTAVAGLPWADANSSASGPSGVKAASGRNVSCVRYDADDTPYCFRLSSGPPGLRGRTGRRGAPGVNGTVGPMGAVGIQGPAGAQGARGAVGAVGARGATGLFGPTGSDANNHLIVVLGSKVGPLTINPGPATGTELNPPSVARCPTSGPDQEAYDGGANVTYSNPAAGDVVGLEASYPGRYVGSTEVDPLPISGTPGAVSPEAANAYEAKAVIETVKTFDQVTLQSYVVCGP